VEADAFRIPNYSSNNMAEPLTLIDGKIRVATLTSASDLARLGVGRTHR